MQVIFDIIRATWNLFLDAAVYVVFGLLVSGMIRVFLNPGAVARHFGRGRFSSVFKAALLGIPVPLCSCGVLPAVVGFKKQGANNGAATAFLISTPESGVDSIALTYALLDPIMTVARPVAAFISAAVAGLAENLLGDPAETGPVVPDLRCPVDGCCDGVDCPPEKHRRHHTRLDKLRAGLGFALTDVWGDIASWFWVGLVLAGTITTLFPADLLTRYLGGGWTSMLLMLALGIPLYICATASTPIAAALILKGVSPGAALVFLLAGPATNITSLTVLLGTLGKRATVIYLSAIAVISVLCGLALDRVYTGLGVPARAAVGRAAEIMPVWAEWAAGLVLIIFSIGPVWRGLKSLGRHHHHEHCSVESGACQTGST